MTPQTLEAHTTTFQKPSLFCWPLKFASLFALTLVAGTPHSLAARWSNQFIEFELPPQWQCNLEGSEFVCQSTQEQKKRDALIVFAAKFKGEQDSLIAYEAYLKAPKSYTSVQGKPIKSEPKFTKSTNLNNQAWIDSLHMESELPGFYTRYLATVKDDIAVLVTYSINKNRYAEYQDEFENMVKTMKVFRKAGGLNVAPATGNLFSNTQVPQGVGEGTVYPTGNQDSTPPPPPPKKKTKELPLTYILIGAAVVALLLLRKKKD
jgi:hypothetical protein